MSGKFDSLLEKLALAGSKILVAVSGGLDSVVLLNMLAQAGKTVAVAHANFQLRGEESDGDENFVRTLAKDFDIPVFVKRFETNNYAIKNNQSIQMAARELRYEWFQDLAEENGYDLIATAHHLNDTIETTLINLTRGTGLAGLSGINAKNGNVIRPLLHLRRSELESYASSKSLTWREDSSNASDYYQRNAIRHHVIPKLRELNPSFEETHLATLARLSAAKELMDIGLEAIKNKFEISGGLIRIPRNSYNSFSEKGAVLYELIKEYGFNLAQSEKIITSNTGSTFSAGSFSLNVDREYLILSTVQSEIHPIAIEEKQSHASLGPWSLTIAQAPHQLLGSDEHIALLDGDKLEFPLTWRPWRAGDFFTPLGMSNRKKISDFLIDRKTSMAEKKSVTVLESGGKIAWVVGYRIDDYFKVTVDTKVTFALRVHLENQTSIR